MKAIQLHEFGGADAFQYVDLEDPTPGEGEVLVEVTRCGVNFADTHSTRNDYLAEQQLPLVPGAEVAGRTPDGRRVAVRRLDGGPRRLHSPQCVMGLAAVTPSLAIRDGARVAGLPTPQGAL